MKIIVAMDSFKSTIPSFEACEIVAQVIKKYLPSAGVIIKPMADGGEGTVKAIIKAANFRWIPLQVTGPLPEMQVDSGFAWLEDKKVALVEMASASGLELLSKNQRNPLATTTYGTGQLVKAAAEYRAEKILLAVGGSATVDCGAGAAMALGWRFLDKDGCLVSHGGGGLGEVVEIVRPEELELPPVEVLCDVDNPLCGPDGAARVYGPQKGATEQMVKQLEDNLLRFASVIKEYLSLDIIDVPGSGAAGGLAAGAIAFMGACLVSGIKTVIAYSGLKDELSFADWIITGEGSFDLQSSRGKVISGIVEVAKEEKVKVGVIAGQVKLSSEYYRKLGVTTAISCRKDHMAIDYALKNSRLLLANAAEEFVKSELL